MKTLKGLLLIVSASVLFEWCVIEFCKGWNQ